MGASEGCTLFYVIGAKETKGAKEIEGIEEIEGKMLSTNVRDLAYVSLNE